MSTTTETFLDPQMETRTNSIHIEKSMEKTEDIQSSQAHYTDMFPWEKDEALKELRRIRILIRFIHDFGVQDVVIPFSDEIKLPSKNVRIHRDRPKLMEIV